MKQLKAGTYTLEVNKKVGKSKPNLFVVYEDENLLVRVENQGRKVLSVEVNIFGGKK